MRTLLYFLVFTYFGVSQAQETTLLIDMEHPERTGHYSIDTEKNLEIIKIDFPLVIENPYEKGFTSDYNPMVIDKQILITRYPHRQAQQGMRINYQIKDLSINQKPLSMDDQQKSTLQVSRLPKRLQRTTTPRNQYTYMSRYDDKILDETKVRALIDFSENLLNEMYEAYLEQELNQTSYESSQIRSLEGLPPSKTLLDVSLSEQLHRLLHKDQPEFMESNELSNDSEGSETETIY